VWIYTQSNITNKLCNTYTWRDCNDIWRNENEPTLIRQILLSLQSLRYCISFNSFTVELCQTKFFIVIFLLLDHFFRVFFLPEFFGWSVFAQTIEFTCTAGGMGHLLPPLVTPSSKAYIPAPCSPHGGPCWSHGDSVSKLISRLSFWARLTATSPARVFTSARRYVFALACEVG
jgi:hypothetical protein